MTELEEFDEVLNNELDRLQKELDSYQIKDYTQKKNSLKKIQALIKSISTQIESYELEINNLDRGTAQRYNSSLKGLQNRFQRLKTELDFKKNEASNQDNLFKDRVQASQNPREMDQYQMINLGDETQEKAMQALQNVVRVQGQAEEVGNSIQVELDKQIAQLDRMYDTVKDTQSTLKRTQKYLKYFARFIFNGFKYVQRQIYTDKLLMCLMGMIFIVIIVLIILSALGLDKGKFNVPDEVRNIAKTNSTLLLL